MRPKVNLVASPTKLAVAVTSYKHLGHPLATETGNIKSEPEVVEWGMF